MYKCNYILSTTYIISIKETWQRATAQNHATAVQLAPCPKFPILRRTRCCCCRLHALSRSRSLVPLYYATSLNETAFAASIAGSSAHECAFHTCGKPKLFKTNHVRREFHVFGTKFTFYGIRGGGPYNHGKCQPMHTTF